MNWHRPSSLQLIINDLNEIAADAYRHRIRSRNKKGGNGAYDTSNGGFSYQLPSRFFINQRARFEILSSGPDFISLKAVSHDDPDCFVSAVVDHRGRLTNICVPGESRRPLVPQVRIQPSPPVRIAGFSKVYKDI